MNVSEDLEVTNSNSLEITILTALPPSLPLFLTTWPPYITHVKYWKYSMNLDKYTRKEQCVIFVKF